MFYHKVYMNQIHSSSLLCQLAAMWKSQVLCDAVIKTGNVSTKAHRVVLVAACPMLHSMKNASTGSNLEVRLASDISQEAVNTFLQYLYEGFMMLTEANCKDVEKIARVLQVDNVLKCCSDFYKCLHAGNGYEYNFHDNVEFRHVRASDLLKVHERSKRAGETMRADSPSTKRMRSFRTGSADQSWQTDHGAGMSSADPWDRVPREGLMSSRGSQPGIIDMVEDSVEIVHTEPLSDSGGKSNSNRSVTLPQDRVALSVASQMNASSDVQIIDTSYANSGQSGNTQQDSISVIGSYSSPQYQHTASSHSTPHTTRQSRADAAPRFQTPPTSHKSHIPSQSPPRIRGSSSQPKPFAVGSASQSIGAVSPSVSSPARESPVVPSPVSLWRSQSAEMINVPPDKSPSSMRTENRAISDTDIMSEVSIIKIESPDGENFPQEEDPNLTFKVGEQSGTGEDGSNEGSNLSSTDKNVPQWLAESMKDSTTKQSSEGSVVTKPNVTFLSGRHGGVEMTNYLLIEPGDPLPAGYVRVDEEERVCVPSVWLTTTLRYCTGKPASFTIKKLLDGFINPWEYKYGGTSAYRNTPYEPIFNALMYMPFSHGKMFPFTAGYGLPLEQHALVPTEGGKLKPCALCTYYRVKTKSGWKVYTRRRCYACDVPLCHGPRNCFHLYHSRLTGSIMPMPNSRSSDSIFSRMVTSIMSPSRKKEMQFESLQNSEIGKVKGQVEEDSHLAETDISQYRIYEDKDIEPSLGPSFDDNLNQSDGSEIHQDVVKLLQQEGSLQNQAHSHVNMNNKQKRCAMCKYNKRKTVAGWDIITQFQCSFCQVPLCKGTSNCFSTYHTMLQNGTLPASLVPDTDKGESSKQTEQNYGTGTGSMGSDRSRSPGARLSHYIDKLTELQTQALQFDQQYPKMKSSPPLTQSNVVRGLDLTIRSQQTHTPTYNKDRKYTPCLYCCKLKNRTRSGWRVNTFYKCKQCDVPLCVNDRNCFALYHKVFLGINDVGRPPRQRSKDGRHSSGQ